MSKRIEIELTVGGVNLTVSGYYFPEEPMVMYDDNMEGYPGCDADFQLESAQIDGKEIINLISDEIYEEIIEKAIEHLKD